MPIHTQDYRPWTGVLKPHNVYTRWWVITKAELKLLAQRKIVRLIVAIPPVIYILVHALLIYIVNEGPEVPLPFDGTPGTFQKFLFRLSPVPSAFIIALIAVFGGSGLIATDLKHNVLSLYLSKPISWVDYLLGKFAVVAILLACLTLVPGLFLFFEVALLERVSFLKANYWVPFSIIAYSLLIILPTSLLVLLFSSFTSNPRYATIGFCAVWFGSPIIYSVIKPLIRNGKVAVVSIWANYDRLGSALFDTSPDSALHWGWALFTLLVLTGLSLFVLRRRIRAIEIVK